MMIDIDKRASHSLALKVQSVNLPYGTNFSLISVRSHKLVLAESDKAVVDDVICLFVSKYDLYCFRSEQTQTLY